MLGYCTCLGLYSLQKTMPISVIYFFEYNLRLYSLGGLAGNDQGLSTLFVQAGVTPPVNSIKQICRCPGDTVKYPQIMP